MVSKHYCGQSFGTCDERSSVSTGCGAQPCELFFDDFLSIFRKKFLVLKDRILGNTKLQKSSPSMTGKPNILRPSRREIKIDVS